MTHTAASSASHSTHPAALVIFGITGNLSRHMLLPALYHLESENLLAAHFTIVGIFRREPNIDVILNSAASQIERSGGVVHAHIMARLKARIHAIHMDSTNPADFTRLAELLSQLDRQAGTILNHLFYLAIPPDIFERVIGNLSSAGLNQDPATSRASRILIEKPFGYDLPSAQKLIKFLSGHFQEHQIFRIDHYLAKETAQNILTFRFKNPLIEGIWSRQFIDHIQITGIEHISIQGRAAFYENMGALRDFMQSHLMQLLALVTMEYPEDLTASAIHREKLKLLSSIAPIMPKHIEDVAVRGQYSSYRDEVSNPHSNTETYAALKLEVDNPRWQGVPVLMRTGKSLSHKTTEIVVVFKDRTHRSDPDNLIVIRLQPNEGIALKLLAKRPGFETRLQPVHMDFSYSGAFDGHQPDAYQRVLIDAMRGDQSLFATSDEVLASWRVLQPVVEAWSGSREQPEVYAPGSHGPNGADQLAGNHGTAWIDNREQLAQIRSTSVPAPPTADPPDPADG